MKRLHFPFVAKAQGEQYFQASILRAKALLSFDMHKQDRQSVCINKKRIRSPSVKKSSNRSIKALASNLFLGVPPPTPRPRADRRVVT